jgi:mevalonate pyrophosphate decarboxylase
MKKQSISDIETMMQYNDEKDFQKHCEKIETAYLELVERKVSSSPAILYVKGVG